MSNSVGAQAPSGWNSLFAALKRCATQELHAAVESHVSRRMRDDGHPALTQGSSGLVISCLGVLICSFYCATQDSDQKPAHPQSGQSAPIVVKLPPHVMPMKRADAIFIHANIYTGVPAETQFGSVLRAEAIAVRD